MKNKKRQRILKWAMSSTLACFTLILSNRVPASANNTLGGPTHLGTFEGQTTFTTSSSNGINPGLYLEVMDQYGNYTEYTSEEGVITVDGTKEGAYVTQAKLLGKTKYVDQDTGEILDTWEEGRNLKLESVKMPVLTTTGKNMFDGKLTSGAINGSNGAISNSGTRYYTSEPILLQANLPYTFTISSTQENADIKFRQLMTYKDKKLTSFAGTYGDKFNRLTYTSREDVYVVLTVFDNSVPEQKVDIDKVFIQIEQDSTATTYEPHKTNILTVNEAIELRGIGEVQDELNLITGELTQHINEIILNGDDSNNIQYFTPQEMDNTVTIFAKADNGINQISAASCLSDKMPSRVVWSKDMEGIWLHSGDDDKRIRFRLAKSKLLSYDLNGVKQYLKSNPITLQYQTTQSPVKTVDLTSTYEFPPVNTRQVLVEGEILPLICSVTTPTEPLSFVLNPNLEEGHQFIAPDFTINNDSPASVSIELKNFEQTTNVLNDVQPDTYQNWSALNKLQSKDIALALIPKSGDGWETLQEGPRYVADNSNYYIGDIKANSSVDFTFEAFHGQAFTEALNPHYRLVVLFEF